MPRQPCPPGTLPQPRSHPPRTPSQPRPRKPQTSPRPRPCLPRTLPQADEGPRPPDADSHCSRSSARRACGRRRASTQERASNDARRTSVAASAKRRVAISDAARVTEAAASPLYLSRRATRGPGKASSRHADSATSRGSRGKRRGEGRGGGRGSADEPRDEGASSVAAGEREFCFLFFCVFRFLRLVNFFRLL